ncbi:MAG: chorismate synthase [Bdellovibrionia bacterium]
MGSLRFLTAGESHGKALVGILEGLPAGLPLSAHDLHQELKRRKLGYGRGARQKIETDEVQILSGVRHGLTLGSPICLLMWNLDWESWKSIMQVEPEGSQDSKNDAEPLDPLAPSHDLKKKRIVYVPRPGHADWVGGVKYAHSDLRNVLERSSARETAMRVALGAVARHFLKALGIELGSRVVRLGSAFDSTESGISVSDLNQKADASPVRCLNPQAEKEMMALIDQAQLQGDTVGGEFEVQASGLPMGLGSYVQWDRRLEAEIGRAFLSLNAIKGVEVGLGFEAARRMGSEVHDEFFQGGAESSRGHPHSGAPRAPVLCSKTNRSGGIDGGMSTGQVLMVRAAMKPLSTLMKPLASVDLTTGEPEKAHVERSDVCAVPAASVIGESLLALVLSQSILEKFGGDSLSEVKSRVEQWKHRHPS